MVDVPQLSLTLFMARIGTDDQQLTVPAHQLAILANALNARSHFHDPPPPNFGRIGNRFYNSRGVGRQGLIRQEGRGMLRKTAKVGDLRRPICS
jgi:hypothetical protein